MSIRDRLVPAVAGAAVLMVALMVIALLRSAANDGTDALEKAKVAQVRTTADSFNARVESSIDLARRAGAPPLGADPGQCRRPGDAEDVRHRPGRPVRDASSSMLTTP